MAGGMWALLIVLYIYYLCNFSLNARTRDGTSETTSSSKEDTSTVQSQHSKEYFQILTTYETSRSHTNWASSSWTTSSPASSSRSGTTSSPASSTFSAQGSRISTFCQSCRFLAGNLILIFLSSKSYCSMACHCCNCFSKQEWNRDHFLVAVLASTSTMLSLAQFLTH